MYPVLVVVLCSLRLRERNKRFIFIFELERAACVWLVIASAFGVDYSCALRKVLSFFILELFRQSAARAFP